MWDEVIYPSHASKVQPLKFGNGGLISSPNYWSSMLELKWIQSVKQPPGESVNTMAIDALDPCIVKSSAVTSPCRKKSSTCTILVIKYDRNLNLFSWFFKTILYIKVNNCYSPQWVENNLDPKFHCLTASLIMMHISWNLSKLID